jgi:nuclear pore complex protein Nup155
VFRAGHIATLLVRFALNHKGVIPYGWAPRILVQCGVPYVEIWDVFHEMYESQVNNFCVVFVLLQCFIPCTQIPPFNDQPNVQAISSDIAVLLGDWLDDARRPQSSVGRGEFPVGRIDHAIDQYLAELDGDPRRAETKSLYENIKRQLRRNW